MSDHLLIGLLFFLFVMNSFFGFTGERKPLSAFCAGLCVALLFDTAARVLA